MARVTSGPGATNEAKKLEEEILSHIPPPTPMQKSVVQRQLEASELRVAYLFRRLEELEAVQATTTTTSPIPESEPGDLSGGREEYAEAGFTDTNQDVSKNFIATGSIAVLHDSGLNASIAGGKTGYQNQFESFGTPVGDTAGDGIDDPHFFYVGVGYNAKLFGVGGTGFHLGWNTTDNNVLKNNHDDNEGEAWAISAVQQFKSIGTEIGIEYANYSYDSKSGTTENTFDDVDALTLMTVFKF